MRTALPLPLFLTALCLLVASPVLARHHPRHRLERAEAVSFPTSMVASFYGAESGRRTASGEPFRPSGLTAAHRSLPFGTRLRVCRGERCVSVRVTDRGPFIAGRQLDLSSGAAAAIGLTAQGVGRVEVSRAE